ncbi:hypothetical protein CFC21_099539 [Triticum aestivum]|uniref:Uncharacterized protein n=3 Tax=Triticum TaxID=4564 RepID=A0A3B6RLK6_WHEAT|nr:hypothetical protein TRIUR3_22920 [Triticum urartu]KAF7097751.1 hypothetical protein CFC21_099539 [Triticum aestivum]
MAEARNGAGDSEVETSNGVGVSEAATQGHDDSSRRRCHAGAEAPARRRVEVEPSCGDVGDRVAQGEAKCGARRGSNRRLAGVTWPSATQRGCSEAKATLGSGQPRPHRRLSAR